MSDVPPDASTPNFVFAPAPVASVAVAGSDARFPVRRIFCVGRNYVEHALEMGGDPDREPPFFFTKPADAVVESGAAIPYPPLTADLHHEIELVVAIGKGGVDIDAADALGHVFGYAVGLDMTRRDLQAQAKKAGRPWDWAKAFDRSAPIAPIRRVEEVGHPGTARIWLSVDGEIRQDSDIARMIWPVADVIAIASRSVALEPGDLIMTGTPEGVGPVRARQAMRGGIDGLGEIDIAIV